MSKHKHAKPYEQTTDALKDAIHTDLVDAMQREGFADRCAKAIAMLQATDDGDDLAPEHLYLVQLLINEQANDAGLAAFEQIYQDVMAGKYRKPWLAGVEHLTRNHIGDVFWKDVAVEHYTAGFASTERGKAEAAELGRRCRYLESIGVQPSLGEAIWFWDERYEANSRKDTPQ